MEIYISFEDSLSMNRVKEDSVSTNRIRALQRDCIMHMNFERDGRKDNKWIGISKNGEGETKESLQGGLG